MYISCWVRNSIKPCGRSDQALHSKSMLTISLTIRPISGYTGQGRAKIRILYIMMFITWFVPTLMCLPCNGQDLWRRAIVNNKMTTNMMIGQEIDGWSTHVREKSHSHHRMIQNGTRRMISCTPFTNQLSQQLPWLRKNPRTMELSMIGPVTGGPGTQTTLVGSHSHHHTILSGTQAMTFGTASTNRHNPLSNLMSNITVPMHQANHTTQLSKMSIRSWTTIKKRMPRTSCRRKCMSCQTIQAAASTVSTLHPFSTPKLKTLSI